MLALYIMGGIWMTGGIGLELSWRSWYQLGFISNIPYMVTLGGPHISHHIADGISGLVPVIVSFCLMSIIVFVELVIRLAKLVLFILVTYP